MHRPPEIAPAHFSESPVWQKEQGCHRRLDTHKDAHVAASRLTPPARCSGRRRVLTDARCHRWSRGCALGASRRRASRARAATAPGLRRSRSTSRGVRSARGLGARPPERRRREERRDRRRAGGARRPRGKPRRAPAKSRCARRWGALGAPEAASRRRGEGEDGGAERPAGPGRRAARGGGARCAARAPRAGPRLRLAPGRGPSPETLAKVALRSLARRARLDEEAKA